MKKMLLMIVAVIVLGTAAQAAFNEDFDTFSLGTLTAQESWEARTDMDVVATTSSGEYIGGRALSPNNTSDKTTRHDGTGVDFALTVDQGGIEYGFDIREDFTSAVNTVLYPREGRTANYGPSVGLAGGYFAIRPNATSGDTFTETGSEVPIGQKVTGSGYGSNSPVLILQTLRFIAITLRKV
jgi:opacity protein-like surface antigen